MISCLFTYEDEFIIVLIEVEQKLWKLGIQVLLVKTETKLE